MIDRKADEAVKEARKALLCLHLAVENTVAADVQQKVERAFDALAAKFYAQPKDAVERLAERLCASLPNYMNLTPADYLATAQAALAAMPHPAAAQELADALESIFEAYPDPEMNHVDYRVFAARTAEKALDRYKASTGFLPPPQPVEESDEELTGIMASGSLAGGGRYSVLDMKNALAALRAAGYRVVKGG